MKVADIMNPNVIYAEVPGNREQVLETIQEKKISGMPLVKKGTKNLIGIITREDLLRNPEESQLALIMSKNVVTISAESPFEDCIKLMKQSGYRRIPVVSGDQLVGIITVGDIVHKVLSGSITAATVKDYVRRKVFSVWGRTPVFIASRLMHLANEYAALIVDDLENIVGIVSNTDLISLGEMKLEERKSILKSGSESQEWDWEPSSVLFITQKKISLPKVPINKVMSSPCITISENASVVACAQQMRQQNIDQLVVVNDREQTIGMIFDIDLINAL